MVVTYEDDLEPIGIYNDRNILMDDVRDRWPDYTATFNERHGVIDVIDEESGETITLTVEWFNLNTWGG